MNDLIDSRFGRALYEALPEIYRTRDGQRTDDGQGKDNGEGHLAAYLDSCGKLLDVIYNSLDQRYKDCFPETCQEWLLPYFAELLGASTLSPHLEGRRKEIMHAIAWQQGKGTLETIAQIAKEIGGFENLLVQEGWKRVARAARIDCPSPSPAIVNLRRKTPQDFVGYRNTAVHSVDVRKPNWRQGHANPRAILLYAPPDPGFFTDGEVVKFQWKLKTKNVSKGDAVSKINNWFDIKNSSALPDDYMELDYDKKTETWHFFKKPGVTATIHITGDKTLEAVWHYHFTEINLDGTLTVTNGMHLKLERLAAHTIAVRGPLNSPSFYARDCLLHTLIARNVRVELVYCTVFGTVDTEGMDPLLDGQIIEQINASDCIFTDILYRSTRMTEPTKGNGIRYSRHGQEARFGHIVGNTTDMPVFYTTEWGRPGCGVIHPSSPESICNGAEDRGEMGAFHHRAHVLAWQAVTRKLLDYLPVGMNAALIPDIQNTAVSNDSVPVTATTVFTVAGSIQGFADGKGDEAKFNHPRSITIDTKSGDLYVVDGFNRCIRKVTPDGVVTTFAGSGGQGHRDGPADKAQFYFPHGIIMGASGNLYVLDSHCIRVVTPRGDVSTFAGSGTQGYLDARMGSEALFNCLHGIAIDASGNLYVADTGNHCIRRITSSGQVSTIAGNGTAGFADGAATSDDMAGKVAQFNSPCDVAIDSSNNLYVADADNHRIRVVAKGTVTTLAGSDPGYVDGAGGKAQFYSPCDIIIASGRLYVADGYNNYIRSVTLSGIVGTLTGIDETGNAARFNRPFGIASDGLRLYVADNCNHCIRRIELE